MLRNWLTCCAVCCLVLAGNRVACADDEEDDSLRCVNARSIRGADVIDDNHVLFELQGKRLYLNTLPTTCTGLSRERRFSYDSHTRSLCSRDKIRILREAGVGFYEGKACSLGRFQPITREELQAFLEKRQAPVEPGETEPAEIEDVVKE